jgi:hypothetical protein
MSPEKIDLSLTSLDIHKLHKYCDECPEYSEVRFN